MTHLPPADDRYRVHNLDGPQLRATVAIDIAEASAAVADEEQRASLRRQAAFHAVAAQFPGVARFWALPAGGE